MRILVIGAGVVGITTAWALARRGYTVTVVEALAGPAEATSRGNAGQRSYGFVYPWADPAVFGAGLRGLLRPSGPLKLHFPVSLRTFQFLCMTTQYAFTPGLSQANRQALLQLAQYSRDCFVQLDDALNLAYDGAHRGMMELASAPGRQSELQEKARLLDRLGIAHYWLTASAVREIEPGLQGTVPLYGGLQVVQDGTGDSQAFTRALADACEQRGVRLRYQTAVTGWELADGRIQSVRVRDAHEETIAVDEVVLCAGCGSRDLVRPLNLSLPIYPVKGYSLTARVREEAQAPRSTLVDDHHHLAMTRLGDRVRVTGFAELAGFNRRVPAARIRVLKQGFQSRFPGAADFSDAQAWTGFRPMTPDGPPLLGRAGPSNLIINTGHGTFGWTLSAGSAELVAQLVAGEQPAVDLSAFRADRFSPQN